MPKIEGTMPNFPKVLNCLLLANNISIDNAIAVPEKVKIVKKLMPSTFGNGCPDENAVN